MATQVAVAVDQDQMQVIKIVEDLVEEQDLEVVLLQMEEQRTKHLIMLVTMNLP